MKFIITLSAVLFTSLAFSQYKFDENITLYLPEPHEKYEDEDEDMSLYQLATYEDDVTYALQRITPKDQETMDEYRSIDKVKTMYFGALLGLLPEMQNSGFELADTTFRSYKNNIVFDIRLENSWDGSIMDIRMMTLDGKLYSLVFGSPEIDDATKNKFYNSVEINPNAKQFITANKEEKEKKKEDNNSIPYKIGYYFFPFALVVGIIIFAATRNRNRNKKNTTDF